jgi:hypothetical protein
MTTFTKEQLINEAEEILHGYEIFIEGNPDIYRGGFEWSISKDDCVWDSGLAFDVTDAVSDANNAIMALRHKNYS